MRISIDSIPRLLASEANTGTSNLPPPPPRLEMGERLVWICTSVGYRILDRLVVHR